MIKLKSSNLGDALDNGTLQLEYMYALHSVSSIWVTVTVTG